MTDLFQFLVSGLTIGSIYALVGLGYYLVYISTRVINFYHGALVQLGGVAALSMLVSWAAPLSDGLSGDVLRNGRCRDSVRSASGRAGGKRRCFNKYSYDRRRIHLFRAGDLRLLDQRRAVVPGHFW